MAFDRLEPFGFQADNILAGIICSSNINLHIKKGSKRATIEDFILKSSWENIKKKQSAKEMKAILSTYVTTVKKRDKNG